MTHTPTHKPKKRHALPKAIGITALGAALLLGGPGTLAGWYAETPISDQTISSGSMDLSMGAKTWSLNGNTLSAAEQSALRLVPGDVLKLTAKATPTLEGDTIKATIKVSGIDESGTLLSSGVATAVGTVNGAPKLEGLTKADSGTPVDVSLSIAMAPIGAPVYAADGSLGQGETLDLSAITASLTQTN